MRLSFSEENYLKAIYKLREQKSAKINTNAIALAVASTPASVTDMVQRLHEKKLLHYKRYQGVSLTSLGEKSAVEVIRKHRLWELFLVSKLDFSWDEVHEIAEQLEHIQSDSLVRKLYSFLGKPKWDPHGDPIPDEDGNFYFPKTIRLSNALKETKYEVCSVLDHSADFLKHLDKQGLTIGKKFIIKEIIEYDGSMKISLSGTKAIKFISADVARNLLICVLK